MKAISHTAKFTSARLVDGTTLLNVEVARFTAPANDNTVWFEGDIINNDEDEHVLVPKHMIARLVP